MDKKIEELKEIRELFGIPRHEIAAVLGISEVNIFRWEKGVCSPNPTHRKKIALIIKLFKEDLKNEQLELLAKELGIT